jgi:anti-sigma B factor antagonist
MSGFMVLTEKFDDMAVIRPEGYLNNIVGEKLEKECAACLEMGLKAIVLDFKKIEFINSIGISILLSVIEKLDKSASRLCFSSLSIAHKETFDMLGLTSHVETFKDEAEALERLEAEAKK